MNDPVSNLQEQIASARIRLVPERDRNAMIGALAEIERLQAIVAMKTHADDITQRATTEYPKLIQENLRLRMTIDKVKAALNMPLSVDGGEVEEMIARAVFDNEVES